MALDVAQLKTDIKAAMKPAPNPTQTVDELSDKLGDAIDTFVLGGPTGHSGSHENGGLDEINVGGLSGVLADDQHIIDAEAVSAMGVEDNANPLNHARYTDAEANGLIATHASNADAHHAQDHAATHVTGGGDTIADAIAAGASGLMSGADKTALTGLTDDSMADTLHRHSELSASDGTPNPALSVDAAGLVGIGTVTPNAILEIFKSLGAPTDLGDWDNYHLVIRNDETTGLTSGILLTTGVDNYGGSAIVHYDVGNGGIGDLVFYTKQSTLSGPPVEVLRLDSWGKVGIGIDVPDVKLDVVGAFLKLGADFDDDSLRTDGTKKYTVYTGAHDTNTEQSICGLFIESDGTDNTVNIGGGNGATNTATGIRFYTASTDTTLTGTEKMRIDANGNVGMGILVPSHKLHISLDNDYVSITDKGDSDKDRVRIGESSGDGSYINMYDDTEVLKILLSSYGSSYFRGGNVGIGEITPDELLHIKGAAETYAKIENSATSWKMGMNSGSTYLRFYQGATEKIRFDGVNFNLFGTQLNMRVDSSGHAQFEIDRGAANQRGQLEYSTNNVSNWFVGVPDSDVAGDGSQYFIGQTTGGASANLWIETNGKVGLNSLDPDSMLEIVSASASDAGLHIKAAASQTAKLLNVTDSSDTSLIWITGEGRLQTDIGIRTSAKEWGTSLDCFAYGATTTLKSGTLTGSYDHTGNAKGETLFIDGTESQFAASDVGKWLVIQSGTRQGAKGVITAYIDADTVQVWGAGWDADLTNVSYKTTLLPTIAIGDDNNVLINNGTGGDTLITSDMSTGWISSANTSSFFQTQFLAGEDNIDHMLFNVFANGHNNVDALQILYGAGDLQVGDENQIMQISSDISGTTGGEVDSLYFQTTSGAAEAHAIHVGSGFDKALTVTGATANDPDYGYESTSGTSVDRVNSGGGGNDAFVNNAVNVDLFNNDDDYILIGSDAQFEVIQCNLVSGGSKNIRPTFWYSKAGGNWTALVVDDSTQGFQRSGNISFNAPVDWTKDDEDIDGDPITDAYYVAIRRTYAPTIPILPVESYFKTFLERAGETGMFIDGQGVVKLPYITAAPTAPENGMMWMEADGLHIYYGGAEKLVVGV